MIYVDGSTGEGGGQILRTALTLSVMTQQSLCIDNIRANRSTPGLRPQHLAALRAAAEICGAETEGAAIGSIRLEFHPGEIKPGNFHFDIGTAGATSLVLQTIFLPLSLAKKSSKVTISGGTHVPWSPCFHYLDWQWRFFLAKLGFDLELEMEQAGFYPQGGGQIRALTKPIESIAGLNLAYRGQLKQIRGISGVANLPLKIAERQRNRIVNQLGHKYPLNDLRVVNLSAKFKGTTVVLVAEFENSQACYFGLGALGKPAEQVAEDAIHEFEDFMKTDGVIDQYLADQLLLPLSFASEGSQFRTSQITQHLQTNANVIQQFLPVKIKISGEIGSPGLVHVQPDQPVFFGDSKEI